MKRVICLYVFSSLLLLSCSYPEACYNNLKGIFLFENGNYGLSLVSYRKAVSGSRGKSDYVYYNISRLYRDMGERRSASGILDTLKENSDERLDYRVNYLKGIIAYNEGRYEDAVLFFKKSVKIDNSDIHLIRGLEMAFRQLDLRKRGKKISAEKGFISSDSEKDKKETISNDADSKVSHSASDIINHMYTEEVKLWLGNGDTDQEYIYDW